MRKAYLINDLTRIINEHLPWIQLKNKTILISGANGFLPAYMVETLLYLNDVFDYGIKIIGLVRNLTKAEKRFNKYLNRKDLTLIKHDVVNPINFNEKIDIIIHAASQASPKYYEIDPVGTLSANIIATHQLLQLAIVKQTETFLYFSSGEVYGEVSHDKIPTKEDDYGYINPLNLRACYAESKKMAENMLLSHQHQFGVNIKIIRPFHTYGPGMSLDDGRIYADFISDLLHSRDLKIFSDGSAVRAFCYLSDAVAGFFTVLIKGKYGEAYNISNDSCVMSISELGERLINHFQDKKLSLIKSIRSKNDRYINSPISINYPCIDKAKSLGWQPIISVEEGFEKTLASFEEINQIEKTS